MTIALQRRMVGFLRSPLFFGALLLLALFVSIPNAANAASLSSDQVKITTSGEAVEATGLFGSNLPLSAAVYYSEWLAVLESGDRSRDGKDENTDPPSGYSNGINAHFVSLLRQTSAGASDDIHFNRSNSAQPLSGAYLKIRARAPPAI